MSPIFTAVPTGAGFDFEAKAAVDLGVGVGVGVGVAEGVAVGVWTFLGARGALFQTNFFPDLLQVYAVVPTMLVRPTEAHFAPSLTAAWPGVATNPVREIAKIAVNPIRQFFRMVKATALWSFKGLSRCYSG